MARIRSIKPEFWTDEKVVALSPLARLLFIGMWNFADDDGRGEFSPARLKMQVLPADSVEASELLGEIQREGMITIYSVDGKDYFQIVHFSKHQKVDHKTPSKHPSPPNSRENSRGLIDGREEEGKGKGNSSAPNGAGVPPISENEFPDLRKQVFDLALPTLKTQGHSEQKARSVIGRWRQLCGNDDAALVAALADAAKARPADLVSWMGRALSANRDPPWERERQRDEDEIDRTWRAKVRAAVGNG